MYANGWEDDLLVVLPSIIRYGRIISYLRAVDIYFYLFPVGRSAVIVDIEDIEVYANVARGAWKGITGFILVSIICGSPVSSSCSIWECVWDVIIIPASAPDGTGR